ncbi:MAG TPA: hypothetical protein DF966_18235 [Sulfitobacter sp.]|nr:hypothetical protein [Sulfitobacter sp.]
MPIGTIDGGFIARGVLSRAAGFLRGFTFKVWLAVCAALLACIPLAYCKGQGDGKALERIDQIEADAEAAEESANIERDSAAQDHKTKQEGEGVIAERRKDHDNAKQGIPDQPLTDRQSVRRCSELRRQGKACAPASPAR